MMLMRHIENEVAILHHEMCACMQGDVILRLIDALGVDWDTEYRLFRGKVKSL